MALSPPLFVSQKPNPNNDATLLQPTSWNRMVDLLNHTFDSQDPTGSILTRDTTDPIDGAKWLHLPGSATLYLDGTGNFSTPPGSGGTGNVTGPASAVIGDVAIFSSTTGKAISDSGKTLPTGALVGLTDTQTLTNKTLASPTLQTPTISDFSLAVHTHMTVAQGGRLSELALNLTDVTTANATTALHGFLPKLSGLSTQVLNGVGNWVALSAGNVTGPVGAATNNVVTFADTTGTLIKDSGIASANLPLLNAGNVFTLNQTIQTSGMPPALFLTDAAGAANQKRIGLYNNAAKFQVTAIDDALSTFTVMASLTRAGVLTATSFVGANATTSAQGLLPTLSGVATQFLNGAGAWTTPGSGGVAGADKQIQFNQAGAFGAQATLTYDRAFFDLVLTNGGADGTGGTGNVPAVILQQTQDLRKTRLYGYACGSFLTHNRSYDISASGFDDPSQISLILGMGGTWGCGFAREGPSGAGFVDLLTVDFNGLAKAQLGLQIGSTGAAQSGQIRLGNTDTVSTRNAANTADYILIGSTGSDGITIGATGHPVGVPDTLTAQGNLIGKSFQTLDTYYIIQETASTGPQVVFVNPGAPSGAKNWAWSFDSSTGPLYLHTYADTTWYPSTTPLQINPDGSVVIGGALTATHFVGANATTSAQGLLPTLSGSATQYLNGTGAWSTPAGGGGGGTPGGANTQVQFNASGAFGGSANFTYDTTYHSLLLTNGSDTAHVPVLTLQNTPDVRKTRFFGYNQSLWITFNDDWSITNTPDDATKRSLYLWIDDPGGSGFATKDAGPEYTSPWRDLLWTDLAGNVIAYNSLGVGPLNAQGSTNTLAQSGAIRLQNTATITWRNAANTADIAAIIVDAADVLTISPGSNINLYPSGSLANGTVFSSNYIYPNTDNLVDIGISSNRYRNLFLSGALTAMSFIGANATTSAQGLLPTLSGSATQYLNGTGAWSTPAGGGGGGTPGGANTQVQFNASGAFGGSANFTYDTTYHSLLLTNGSDTAHVPVLTLQNTPDVRKTRFFGWNQSLWITFNDDWSITSTPDDATKRSLYLWIDDPDGGGFSTKDAGPENAPWHDLLWTDLAGNVIAYNSLGVGPLNAAGSTNTLAQSGAIRLQNTATITWRNAANTADIPALGVDVNNALLLGNACPYIEILAGALCAPTNSFDLGSPSGQFRAGYFGTSAIIGQGVGNGSILVHGDSSSTSSLRLSADSSYARVNTSAGHDLFLGVGGTDCWFIDPYYGNAGWMPNGDNTRDIGVASNRVRNVAVGTAVSIGTNPAQSGAIRLQNNDGIYARNAANAADIPLIATDGIDRVTLADASHVVVMTGELANFGRINFATGYLIGAESGNPGTPPATTGILRYRNNGGVTELIAMFNGSTQVLAANGGYSAIGTNPAQSGAIRLANNQGLYARNAANTADIPLIGTNGSDQVLINGTVYAGGNVTGPSTSVVNNLATYNNTTGTLLKDSGIAAANIALLNVSNAFTANIVLSSNGATFVQTDTSAVANSRVIAFSNAAQKWTIISYDDAYGTPVNMLDVTRGGNATIYGTIKERGRTTPLGEWIDVGFTASNFTSNTGTWTVTSGGQQTYAYMVIGKTLWIILSIIQTNSTITGTPTELWVTLPSGFTVAPSGVPNGVTYAGPAVGAGYPIGYAYTLAGESKVRLIRDPTASGTFAAGAIGIWATFSLRIQ